MNIDPYVIPGLMTFEEIAADIWEIPVRLLYIHTRNREVVECRHMLFHYLTRTTTLSPANIGIKYGMDRNTVKHACENISNLLETHNEEFIRKYDLFYKRIL
jgi:chromosomal replication initiation ATPase DnaA